MPKIMCAYPWAINDCICGECLRNADVNDPGFNQDYENLAPRFSAPMSEGDCKHFEGN